jgi:Protein of unknown function (DUF3298)
MMLAAGVLAAVLLSGCSSSTGSTATPGTPAGPATATSATVAESACTSLGGTVGGDQTCRVHSDTARYTLDFRFPVDYPDQQALTDAVTQERDGFVDWASGLPPQSFPYELDIIGKAYRSGTPAAGTQSLVFDVGTSGGVHPVTTYSALNYDLSKHAPITLDTLFKPGTQPMEVLNPIVQPELDKHGATGSLTLDDLGAKAYQNFAITDNAVLFFLNQDGLLPHEKGPLTVEVPRTEIASFLA